MQNTLTYTYYNQLVPEKFHKCYTYILTYRVVIRSPMTSTPHMIKVISQPHYTELFNKTHILLLVAVY